MVGLCRPLTCRYSPEARTCSWVGHRGRPWFVDFFVWCILCVCSCERTQLWATSNGAMTELVLGPLLRHAGSTDATVWVETDAACEVEVLGCSSRTFRVGEHHYALVHVTGLAPGDAREYEVRLDGKKVWPESGSPFPP